MRPARARLRDWLLVLAAVVAWCVPLAGQTASGERSISAGGEDTGRVVDESGGGIAFATLTWTVSEGKGGDRRTDTDAEGYFRLPPGLGDTERITVSALGYESIELLPNAARQSGWRIVLTSDPLELSEMIVTASGRLQRRSEVAVPVARVSAAEIEISGATSALELLSEVPGIEAVSGTPVGATLRIRGIGESRVLVLVDGQPSGGAFLENRDLGRLSLGAVERVEVVKGPMSALYGSDALGGVVNVITRAPAKGFQSDLRMGGGDGGRYEGSAAVSGGGSVLYRATGSWRQQDRVPGLNDLNSAFSRVWDLRTTVRTGSASAVALRADVHAVRERQRWPIGGGFSGFNDNRGVTGWIEALRPVGGGTVTGRLFGQNYHHLFRSARGTAPIAGADEDLQTEQLWKASVTYAGRAGGHGFDLGAEVATRAIESPDKILEDRASDQQLDLFAQDAWTLNRTSLSAGARLTLNDRWGRTVSPTLGVAVLATSAVRLRGTVGRGFRAPSFKELAWDFANLGAGYTVRGFDGLEPEQSWNASAGVEWAPARRIGLGFDIFDNRIDNLIETTFVGNEPGGLLIYSPRNVRRARTRGLEASASVQGTGWDLAAEYALLVARSIEDDLPLDRRSRHSARVRLQRVWPVAEGALLSVTTRLTGSAPIIGLGSLGLAQIGRQARYVGVDLHGSLRITSGVELTAGVENVFDVRPDGWQAAITRRLRLGLQARDIL